MIRVTIDKIEYRIDWAYWMRGRGEARGAGFQPEVTECRIYQADDDYPSWTADANLHPNDRFCKETGRKLSLAKALAGWDREDRAVVWRAYFNRFRKEVGNAVSRPNPEVTSITL